MVMALSHINGLGQRTSPYTQNNSSADEITNPVEYLGVGGITLEHGDIKRTFDQKKPDLLMPSVSYTYG